jgi:hypothetical protein
MVKNAYAFQQKRICKLYKMHMQIIQNVYAFLKKQTSFFSRGTINFLFPLSFINFVVQPFTG